MAKHKYLKIVCDACCHIPNAHRSGRIGIGKSAGGILYIDNAGNIIDRFGEYFGELTVPQAEYRAVILALDKASGYCRGECDVWLDSELIVKQMNGVYAIRSDNIKPLFHEVKRLEERFDKTRYFHHSRNSELAKKADAIAEETYRATQG